MSAVGAIVDASVSNHDWPVAALDEANAALKLEPDWSYVRDNLMPQIDRQLRLNER